ncbi:hypothetical protein GGR56DRAFT_144171 [Xylariaceae sp. FL0804]|nr:hypothetical protein GGR56DRAFT_144171 [Xylariaceae sp. FL0804]
MSWLLGHRLQNLVVFPAAAYISSVLEEAMVAWRRTFVALIQILDVDIVSALVFESETMSMDIVLSLTNIPRNEATMEADFTYHSASAEGPSSLGLKAKGRDCVYWGR